MNYAKLIRKFFMSLLLALAIVSLLSLKSVHAASEDAPDQPGGRRDIVCRDVSLSTSLPVPPQGMANVQTITLDANCNPVFGPVQTIPIGNLPTGQGTPGVLPDVQDFDPDAPMSAAATWTVNATQSIWDCCGIMMNKVYTSGSWTENGSIIQSFSIGGGYQYHTESFCGPGWYPVNPYHILTGGGAGQSSATFRTHTEFGYDGIFDCGGTQYYNILDNYTTIYAGANGNATCNFTRWSRTWLGSWSWQTSCTP